MMEMITLAWGDSSWNDQEFRMNHEESELQLQESCSGGMRVRKFGAGGWLRAQAATLYKTWTLKLLYPRVYRKYARRPVDTAKIVFLEVRMPELTDSFLPLYERLQREEGYELKICCIREGIAGRRQVRRNCLAALQELSDAAVILINDSSYLMGCLPIRKETTVIQLWHACGAFKKFGYSSAEKKFGPRAGELERFPVHRNFSYVTVSSQEVAWAYAEAFHMENQPERILPLGISRTDVFFQPERAARAEEHLRKVLEAHGISLYREALSVREEAQAPGPASSHAQEGAQVTKSEAPSARENTHNWKSPARLALEEGQAPSPAMGKSSGTGRRKNVVLYAPTFRGRVADAATPEVLDFARLAEALGEDWIVLCKHHPFVKKRPVLPDSCRGYVLDVTEELEIEELLMVSDVCISDYSSLIFEYSLLMRPMIFLAYDLEDYYDWRGFYYPYEEMAPGPIVRDTEGVIRCLKELPEGFDAERVRMFRDKFMGACDGHATERIVGLIADSIRRSAR